MTVYTKEDRAIEAHVGETFVIELEANPTTGYEWELQLDRTKVDLVDRRFEPAGPGIGAGGLERFALESLQAGETVIVLERKRPFEADAIERLVVQLHAVAS